MAAGFVVAMAAPLLAAHTQARLVLSAAAAKPGDTVTAGIRLRMDAGWHTYWRNPGASGMATEIQWELPPGVTAGEPQWPPPEKYGEADLTTYVHHGEVILLVPLTLAADTQPGLMQLKAKVSWLECKELCVPGDADVEAPLRIGTETQPSADAALFDTWRKRLPRPCDQPVAARWEKSAAAKTRSFLLEWPTPSAVTEADFFPYSSDQFEVQPETERLSAGPGLIRLRKQVKKLEGDWPTEIAGLLVGKSGDEPLACETKLQLPAATPTIASPASLWRMLLYAFLGGLILNVMPCVFPVIALKIFGFVQQSHDDPRRVFKLGLIYGLGVVVSFLVMAGVVIAIHSAGGSATWGMQFKNPHLSVGFIALCVLIALNLFGLFEVTLRGRTMGVAGELASKSGTSGAFFNGVLATVLATPCTAPALATALAFAFAQPPLVILIFFVTIGLGLAAPYVLLSWKPAWLKFLPKPGAWMEKFKIAMGFPMLATAIWILWFTAPRFGADGVIWLGLFLVGLAFAVWIWGEFVQRGSKRRGPAATLSLLTLLASYGYALETKLHWRTPGKNFDKVLWLPWSTAAVAKARSEGRPILVDFTAKWCLTCNKFVKPAVDNTDVRRKLDVIKGVALLADYSDWAEDIGAEIKKFHADGAVPLVLVYPRDASQPPAVLPTVPSRRDVLTALEKAAH